MLKLENSIRGLSFSRVAFDLTIQETKKQRGRRVFCVGWFVMVWYDLVVIEGGEGGFVDVFYAGLLEFDAVSAV